MKKLKKIGWCCFVSIVAIISTSVGVIATGLICSTTFKAIDNLGKTTSGQIFICALVGVGLGWMLLNEHFGIGVFLKDKNIQEVK